MAENNFPLQYLAPGEKVIIILETFLSFDEFPLYYDEDAMEQSIQGLRADKSDFVNLRIWGINSAIELKIGKKDMLALASRSAAAIDNDPRLDTEYSLGPSLHLDGVKVDGITFPVRTFDPQSLVIHEGGGQGSCPTLYTYSVGQGIWLSEGHILYGRNGAHRERREEKKLSRFTGTVLIKERDPEVSYIDFVFVKALLPDGK